MSLELFYGNFYQEELKEILELCEMPTDKIHKGLKIILYDGNISIGGCRSIFSDDGKSALLSSVCIKPEFQKKGYGSKMLGMVHNLLIKNNVENFYLASVTTATNFYKKHNYTDVSISDVPKEFVKPMWRTYSEYERNKSQRRIRSFMKFSFKS